MLKGFPGWEKSGRYLVAANKFIKKGNIILLDLRPAKEAQSGHIARAVNLPLAQLEDSQDDFPSSSTVPIILYGSNDDAEKARKIIKRWGYKKVSLVEGGLVGWQAVGNKLVSGVPGGEIKWVRKLGKGEISAADFQKVLDGKMKNAVILDVRTSDEVTDGMFPGAVHVPLDELAGRLADLPKNKELLVQCSTGVRAEMAHQVLQAAKFKSRFLMFNVECEDGECELEE